MRIFKALGGAAIAGWILTLASCAPTATTTPAAQRVPVEQRVKLVNKATSAQENQMKSYAAAKFGGFEPKLMVNQVDVMGGILVAVNGQTGSNTYYDPLGTYNATWDGALSITSEPGLLKIISKMGHYQISSGRDLYEFRAVPGHEYFIGSVLESPPGIFRWVPVIYDKTAGKVIPLPNVKPQKSAQPTTITLYV